MTTKTITFCDGCKKEQAGSEWNALTVTLTWKEGNKVETAKHDFCWNCYTNVVMAYEKACMAKET